MFQLSYRFDPYEDWTTFGDLFTLSGVMDIMFRWRLSRPEATFAWVKVC